MRELKIVKIRRGEERREEKRREEKRRGEKRERENTVVGLRN